jgi:hypothetical protein
MAYPFILNGQNLSVYLKGNSYSINQTHPNFEKVVAGLRKSLPEDDLIGLIQFHKKELGGVAGVEFRTDGMIYFDGKPMPDALIRRYRFMIKNKFPVEGFKKFILNLTENPSRDSREELYGFLEACSLPITDDGYFLAYKKVEKNYRDCYSGKMDNSVGKTVEMPREKVNSNRHETCSTGLHVCSRNYLGTFGGCRIVVCKINPRDVVSVPVDYSNAKMRVCRYEVIDELKEPADLIKDNAVKIGSGVKVSDGDTVSPEPVKKSGKAGNPKQEMSREANWNDYIKTRGIPEDITSLHGNPRKAFIKFCARLHNRDGSEKAGTDICGARTLAEMRAVILGF